MDAKNLTRKEFLTLTFTLIGSAVAVGACDDDNNTNNTGTAGTSGGAGSGSSPTSTTGAGGTTGAAGTTGAGGSGAVACASPLPETQLPDSTGHTHTVTIAASALNSTTPQTFTTSNVGHTHEVTLSVADLGTIKGGGMATVTSTVSQGHSHTYKVSCT